MPHPIRHTYKPGTPGYKRAFMKVTLTELKKDIALARERGAGAEVRRKHIRAGLLAH
jgi:hypothetical protein